MKAFKQSSKPAFKPCNFVEIRLKINWMFWFTNQKEQNRKLNNSPAWLLCSGMTMELLLEKRWPWTDAVHQCNTILLYLCSSFQCLARAYFGGIILSNSISRNHSLTSPPCSKIVLLWRGWWHLSFSLEPSLVTALVSL